MPVDRRRAVVAHVDHPRLVDVRIELRRLVLRRARHGEVDAEVRPVHVGRRLGRLDEAVGRARRGPAS